MTGKLQLIHCRFIIGILSFPPQNRREIVIPPYVYSFEQRIGLRGITAIPPEPKNNRITREIGEFVTALCQANKDLFTTRRLQKRRVAYIELEKENKD